jgi:hypothetical protein
LLVSNLDDLLANLTAWFFVCIESERGELVHQASVVRIFFTLADNNADGGLDGFAANLAFLS